MNDKPVILPFEQWLIQVTNPALPDDVRIVIPEDEECNECAGSGEHKCSCGDVHDCPECDGTGRAQTNVLHEMRDIYERQVKNDIRKWQNYKVQSTNQTIATPHDL